MTLPKWAACCFFALFLPAVLAAQDTTLQRIRAMKDDTLKVQALNKHAFTFAETAPEKGILILDDARKLSERINYTYGIGQAWLDAGMLHAQQAKDRQAVDFFTKAIPFFKNIERTDKVAACLLNKGACSERFGASEDKIKFTMEAIQLLEGTGYKSLLAHGYNSMGIAFFNRDNFSKAEPYFSKALATAKNAKDTAKMVQAYFGLSNCAVAFKKYKHGLNYSLRALILAEATGNKASILLAYSSLAELCSKWGKPKEVIEYATAMLNYATALNDTHYRLLGLMSLAEGHALSGDQQKRIGYLRQALSIATENDVVVQLDDICKSLSEGYEKLGDYQQAFAAYKQYSFYRDSSINLQSNKSIAELEVKYQSAQKEKALSEKQLQIAQKDLQLRTSQGYLFYSITAAVVALLVAGFLFLYFQNRRKVHLRNLKAVQQEKELQVLQAVLQGEEKERSRIAKDLHDGIAGMLAAVKMHFSSVSVQHEQVLQADAFRHGLQLLDDAAKEVRKTSHNLMPEVLLQHGLDSAIRRYCTNISNDALLQVQYDSWGEVKRFKNSFELSVYRIVQELLNNIFKHSKASKALVQLSQQGSLLSITIEDNGIGFSQQSSSSEGMGLHSLRSRVEAINGQMQVEAEAGSGVSAYLEFDTTGLEKNLIVINEKQSPVTA